MLEMKHIKRINNRGKIDSIKIHHHRYLLSAKDISPKQSKIK